MTALQAIIEAQTTYSDMPTTYGLAVLQDIHEELCEEYPLLVDEITFSSIVAGTPRYALNADVVAVRSVEWWRTSTSHKPLVGMDPDALEAEEEGWRNDSESEPIGFYEDADSAGAKVLGFHPEPDTDTASGYPKAVAQVLKKSTLASGTELPAMVPRSVYVDGIRRKWAEKRDKASFSIWDGLYQQGIKRLGFKFANRNRRFKRQVYPADYSTGLV